MKRKLIGTLVCMLLITTVLPVSGTVDVERTPISTSFGGILYVGGSGPGNYSTIQEAIDDSSDGDTIFVYDDSSPYYENVVVDKSINLIGEDKDTTVIYGSWTKIVVNISSDSVEIEGFTIQRSLSLHAEGIKLDESNFVTISNNIIMNNSWGIYLKNSHFNKIIGNIITKNMFGGIVSDRSANGNIIRDNNIVYNSEWNYKATGIALGISSNNLILNNNISNNDIGIAFFNNKRNNIIGNKISENREHGIHLRDSRNNRIINNDFLDNSEDVYFRVENIFQNNRYFRNYWNESLNRPKIIFGEYKLYKWDTGIPWINIDWLPAQEPYDIGV